MIQGITEINLPSYATLSSATIVDNEMGDKTIETTVAIDTSIVPDFSFDWELEFKGERYIHPLREPQGHKGNESIKAQMDLTFYQKTVYQLKRYFFFETASVGAGTVIADKYEASVYLNLGEFVTLFNEVLSFYFGDDIVMDLNPDWEYSQEKVFIEISSSYIWDVLQKINELYGVRWWVTGDTIYVGYPEAELTHVFEYGFDGGLMKLERQVQDADIRNQLLGRGGSKNLPQYYFKTAPDGSGFSSDPDACPELQYIYFDELRGKTFRDYVKGWNAHNYGGAPMTNPTAAYTKGFTDETFNPIEYMEDPVSIAKYGVFQGMLESNEDIYPSIKGRTVSPYGRVDEIIAAEEPDKDNYDQEANAYNDSKVTILSTLRQSLTIASRDNASVTLPRSEVFTVPAGKVGTIESWIGQWSGYYYQNGQQKDAKGLLDYDVTDFSFKVYNATTDQEVSSSNMPAGSYYFVASGQVANASDYAVYATLEVANIRLLTALPGDQGWKYTFDIWVKNIWQSTQNTGESDEDYAHRVWSPILGSHGEEARVLFDSGWLYGHEDWEFPIISVVKDRSKTRGGIRSEWRLTLKKSDAEMEATGKYIPGSEETVQAHAGDYFHFIGIDMPFMYVEMAEAELDEYKTLQLVDSANIKPTWVVTMDHVRLHTKLGSESQTFYQQLTPGAKVYIRNKQLTDNDSIAFYITSITYTWSSETVIIPNVEIVLSDKIQTVYSPVSLMQSSIRALNSQVGSLREASIRASVASASMYLPKDGTPAKSLSETSFARNVAGSEFREGLLGGVDWGIYRDENGKAIIEADRVVARESLVVNELSVNQISYVGGMQIISAASMECVRVDDTDDGYVCYFDQKQGSVANLFQIGDVAYSHIFSEIDASLKYYKRKVEDVDANCIVLSKTVVDGSGVPMAGDTIIQYGSYTNANRTFVIIRDVIGGGYERMLSGLNSVTATGNEYYFAGKQNGGERWFVGSKATNGQYAEYVNGQLNLKAIVNFLPQSTGLEQLEAYQRLVQIAQGNIETWFHDGVSPAQTGAPTMSNYPVNTWETADYESHVGDIYYSNTGKGYRFKKSGSTYSWEIISDSELAQAMAQIQALQYLRQALGEDTTITGGLILTSLIQLGYTDTSDIHHIMSGISGQGSDAQGIAAWFGGPMVDKQLSPSAQSYAASLFRFDGTGYLAKGNISWDTNGYGWVGGDGTNKYAVKWDANNVWIGTDVKIGEDGNETLESILAFVQKIDSWFGQDSDGNIYVKKTASNVARNFYSYGEISAGGAGTGGGGGTAGIDRIFFGTQKYQAEEGSLAINIPLTGTNGIKGVLGITALEQAIIDAGKIADVKVDGVSVVTNRIANITLSGYATQSWVLGKSYITASALTPYRTSANQDTIDNAIKGRLTTIEGLIPSAATTSNLLADKSFVNSSIATATATFRGTSASGLTEAQFLAWANGLTKDNNDYVFWNTTDSAGNVQFKRYKYNGTSWVYEYTLNNSSFTAAQWAAINSGLTSSDKTALDNALATIGGYGNIVTHNVSEFATAAQGAKADSALQAHQTIYALTVQKNGTTVGTYTPNSAAKTINLTDVASAATLADFKTLFESMFERVGSGTASSPYKIHAKYGFYSDYEVSAGGDGTGGGGGGLIENVYGYTDLGGTYSDSVKTDTFNAYTIARLASRIASLEERPQGGVTSFNTRTGAVVLGSSDVVTALGYTPQAAGEYAVQAADNNLIYHGNEFNFVPSGYNTIVWFNYRTQGGANGNITDYYFANGKGQLLVALSTLISQSSNGNTAYGWGNHASAGYLTGINSSMVVNALGYTPYNAANIGSASVAYAANSGTVGGLSASSFAQWKVYSSPDVMYDFGWGCLMGDSGSPTGTHYGQFLTMPYRRATGKTTPDFAWQIFGPKGDDPTNPDDIFVRTSLSTSWRAWHKLYHSGNFNPANYLPLSGGIMTGNIQVGSYTSFGVSGTDFFLGNPSYPLRIRSNGTTTLNGNTIYHSGNCNNTSTPWSASSLTLNGAISGATTINASGIVTCDSVVGKNISYYDNETGCYVGSAKNGMGSTYTGALILAYGDNPIYFFTNGSRRMQILGNGNVGIGTTSPTEKLTVAGNITATGEISAGSDRRWKHGIAPVADGLSVILRLQPSEWTWNSDNHKGSGLIAQDVQTVLPHLVKTDGNGYLHLAYDGFHAYEIAAIQQLHKKIEELERQLQTLKQS